MLFTPRKAARALFAHFERCVHKRKGRISQALTTVTQWAQGLRQNAFAQHMLKAALDVLQIGQKLENPSPPKPPDDERPALQCGRAREANSLRYANARELQ